ncbi:hypothetical protein Fcan01_24945 [Folsomia candida]|uniref:Uncharacterized protein n=1 Tax=Folsomia candida TaxID=158441 RepID=A0A226D560_FOLCA|nr:hypothetical protein Fcan01_24945 [Folsomia candida]
MKFDPSTQKFVGTQKLRKLQLYGCLSVTLQMINNCWRTHQIYTEYPGGSHHPSFHICFAFGFTTVMASFPLWLVYFKQEEINTGMNRVLKYSVQFQGNWMQKYIPEESFYSRAIDLVLSVCIFFTSCGPWTSFGFFILAPDTPIFAHTILPKTMTETMVGYLAYNVALLADLFFFFGTAVTIWFLVLAFGSLSAMFVFPICSIVGSELQFGPQIENRDKLLFDFGNVHHEYNCVQLLHKEVMNIIGFILFYMHGMCGQFCLYCNFVIIKEWDRLDVHTMRLGEGLTPTEENTEILEKHKTESALDKKLIPRVRRSCRPLDFGAEGIFAIRRNTILKFFRGIVKGTFRALLTIGK